MKLFLLIFFFITLHLFGQEWNQKIGSWEKSRGYTFEFYLLNDSIANFSYSGSEYGSGTGVRYSKSGDTLTFLNPEPKTGCDYVVYYDTISSDSVEIQIQSYDDYGYYTYSLYSFDNIHFDTIRAFQPIRLEKENVPDFIYVDTISIMLDKKKVLSNVYVDIYCSTGIRDKSIFGFPGYFEQMQFVLKNGVWSVIKTPELLNFDLTLYEEMRPVTWWWPFSGSGLGVELNTKHDFIPDSSISAIKINNNSEHEINLNKYTNLKSLEINTNNFDLTLHTGHLDDLTITTNDSSKSLTLFLDQNEIRYLESDMPITATNLLKVDFLSYHIRTIDHQLTFNNNPITARRLNLNYTDEKMNVEISDKWSTLNFVLIEKDTISLDCNIEVLPILDSLVLYGHTNNYDFLNCKHDLMYLGIFYSNESDSTKIRNLYPNIDQQYYCFPIENFIQTTVHSTSPLREIKLGDTVLSFSNEEFIHSKITAVEYHFNSTVTIEYLIVNDELSCLDNSVQQPIFYTTFTSLHPLNISNIAKPIDSISIDEYVQSVHGPISFTSFSNIKKQYSGTLVNVRTDEGNYFINGINFMNK
ncbi:hypothetical protein K6119_04080 [Paracrocinitomix mangrovi]|uniref:hypothetical protein n=1 Tax=Paracrocinitomix mangrovi TaxID=2862509 RepID=UPI001C8D3973|nr:hypothetical protein [Paracrocinitomix mangrovi]UKN02691.1 hypothetical protein K6119_04080 [Paracrocinitomix mangrovi]